jgi:hypothetical protein
MSRAFLFSFNRQRVTMGPTFPFLCKNRHPLLFLTIEILHFAQLTHMKRYYRVLFLRRQNYLECTWVAKSTGEWNQQSGMMKWVRALFSPSCFHDSRCLENSKNKKGKLIWGFREHENEVWVLPGKNIFLWMYHEGGLSFHQPVNCARLVTHAKCVKLIEVLLRQLSVRMHMHTLTRLADLSYHL